MHLLTSPPLFLKALQMAGHRNDSRQMTELLQPDRVHQENASQGASSPAFNSASFYTSPSPSPSASSSSTSAAFCFTSAASNPPASPSYSTSTSSYTASTFSAHRGGRTSPVQPKRDGPLSNPREGCRASCPLENLKRLPQCSGLEPLKCSATHTVLINVRAYAFQHPC